jgi:hypothetical protein
MRQAITLSALILGCGIDAAAAASDCGRACLERIADQYRAAYVAHDIKAAPFASSVRYSENIVAMKFPDGTWDTVTQELGPALTLADPETGQIGIHTAIMQNDTPGFLAIRLRVEDGRITEVEHIISTKCNLSGPPTPIGEATEYQHDPEFALPVDPADRIGRERLIAHANGYFSTLEKNDGEIRGTRFSATATRRENGKLFPDVEQGFLSGYYRFNERVRDRDFILVDEERGVVLARGFIDHKGVLDSYQLTDGTERRSNFREPQSWALLESFKIKGDRIIAVEATFIAVPYYLRSPWTTDPDP